jgi:hypothetical protein
MTDDILTEVIDEATRAFAERLDYEIRGAWRAGHDFVHVYQANVINYTSGSPSFGLQWATVASEYEYPPGHDLEEYRYLATYDLRD